MSATGLIVGGLLGFIVGLLVGQWVGKHRHKNKLVADPTAGNEMRAEAAASVAARTQRRLDKIMALARTQGKIVNDDVEDMFCISDHTARTYLKRLVHLEQLHREGSGGGTYYVPVHTAAEK